MDPPPPPLPPPPSVASLPILAASIIGILSTSILLLSYYVFVIKCCLYSHHPDVVPRLPLPRGRHPPAPAAEARLGLAESAIRAMPTFPYRGRTAADAGSASRECAVCLSEFREEERIKLLPGCLHLFHIDCIDTWLQCNANCPLCRSTIAVSIPGRHFPPLAPGDGDDVAIDVGDAGCGGGVARAADSAAASGSGAASPSKTERGMGRRKTGQFAGSRGDECIDDRKIDEQFCVQQSMRRSFSMDSSRDRELHAALQEILQQDPHPGEVTGGGESSSSSGRLRRSFFSFGRTRSSSVLPVRIQYIKNA